MLQGCKKRGISNALTLKTKYNASHLRSRLLHSTIALYVCTFSYGQWTKMKPNRTFVFRNENDATCEWNVSIAQLNCIGHCVRYQWRLPWCMQVNWFDSENHYASAFTCTQLHLMASKCMNVHFHFSQHRVRVKEKYGDDCLAFVEFWKWSKRSWNVKNARFWRHLWVGVSYARQSF